MSRARASIVAAVLVAMVPLSADGQSLPRASDGKPDLSGIWHAVNSAAWNILPHSAEPGVPGGLGVVEGNEIPYTQAAAAKQRDNYASRARLDPEAQCYLTGVPRATYMGLPFQIVQTPAQITFLYEYDHTVRNAFMNSPHPRGPIQFWMGDSRGSWDRDILVIDVVHFNDQTWFDRAGNHHSEALHVVEQYTLVDRDHINYEVTIEDPKVFTRQWKMRMPLYRRLDQDMRLLDYECVAFNETLHPDPADAR